MDANLDEADRRILREMQRDCSRPVTQLADAVGMSHAPCWRRVQRLRSDGYIRQEVALLDRKKLGWNLELFVEVKLSSLARADFETFTQRMAESEHVIGCYILLGDIDVLLHVIARDIEDYERFLFTQLWTAGVERANSMTLLSEIKQTYELPV